MKLGEIIDILELWVLFWDFVVKGMVFLKNEGNIFFFLVEKFKGKKVVFIGFSKDVMVYGGGSVVVNLYYKVFFWDGFKVVLGDDVEFMFVVGVYRECLLFLINKDGSVGIVIGLDG